MVIVKPSDYACSLEVYKVFTFQYGYSKTPLSTTPAPKKPLFTFQYGYSKTIIIIPQYMIFYFIYIPIWL